MNHGEIVNFIWSVAEILRGDVKHTKFQDVILPMTVIRRLDCVLAPTRDKVREVHQKYKGQIDNLEPLLRKASGFAFYNTSRFDFERLCADHLNLAANLKKYVAGFSPNMREVLENFKFDATIDELQKHDILYQVVKRFHEVDLHPDHVSNTEMGSLFEELLRKFNEAHNETAGEHFTPRDVVRLMVRLLILGDEKELRREGAAVTVYDPCCGSGGMLTISKDVIVGTEAAPGINPKAEVHLFGQELNEETYAICKADLFIKSPDGRDADGIVQGNTLSVPGHRKMRFHYLIANPPYGVDWKKVETEVRDEAETGDRGRFGVGLPRVSDGQLLFLQHMLFHMKRREEGGARIAFITNGSPLFSGDAGSGESQIRRYILENDLLEALIALPEQLFYNTGLATYIWVVTNRKHRGRAGKVLLVDATSFWSQMRRSLGAKRREIPAERGDEIRRLVSTLEEGEFSKIYPTQFFGYRKVTVERPLRLNFLATDERIGRLVDESAFRKLAESQKKDPAIRLAEEEAGRKEQEEIRRVLRTIGEQLYRNRPDFEAALDGACRREGCRLRAPLRKAVLSALSGRDEEAEICRDADGKPEPDSELRDFENVPLGESIDIYFDREVKPYAPDAWVNENVRDDADGKVGKVGYEINFNRYFYKYVPPRPLEEIQSEIRELEKEIVELLREVAG